MKKKGFTLIELLVVIAIIGLLSSIVVVSLGPARKKSRDAKGQSDLKQIMTAFEMKYSDSAIYPDGAGTVIPNAAPGSVIPSGNALLDPHLNPVLTGNGVRSYYWYDDGVGQKFCVYFQLEAPSTTTYFTCSYRGCQTNTAASCPGF
jgi:prepilin-type N-terminal cleavage/methylation domain-containing protein